MASHTIRLFRLDLILGLVLILTELYFIFKILSLYIYLLNDKQEIISISSNNKYYLFGSCVLITVRQSAIFEYSICWPKKSLLQCDNQRLTLYGPLI